MKTTTRRTKLLSALLALTIMLGLFAFMPAAAFALPSDGIPEATPAESSAEGDPVYNRSAGCLRCYHIGGCDACDAQKTIRRGETDCYEKLLQKRSCEYEKVA